MFQKNERAPFNSHNSHYSSVVSEALGSKSPNLPCTGAQLPACAFSSAPAKRCLPRCGHQAAAPEYLESFACCLCTVCSPTAIQNHHLEANLQKRNLLLCFDLFLQPSCRPATGPGRSLPSPPPPWRETPPHVCATWAALPRPPAGRATLWPISVEEMVTALLHHAEVLGVALRPDAWGK